MGEIRGEGRYDPMTTKKEPRRLRPAGKIEGAKGRKVGS